MSVAVTLLSGLSTQLRADVVRAAVAGRAGLAAVSYLLDPGADEPLLREVADAGGCAPAGRLGSLDCCLSCTVRADVNDAVRLVTGAGRWREVVVSLPSAVQPDDVADALAADGVAVDTVSTVVDARLVLDQLRGDDLLADRGLAAAATDRRSTAELVVRQLEAADVLVVAGLEALGTPDARRVQALLAHLAPLALQLPVGPRAEGSPQAVSTGRRGGGGPAERAEVAALAAALCPPSCDVTTLVWHSERPLHSARLRALLPHLVRDVVRSRGRLWLAERQLVQLRWEQVGGTVQLGDAAPWSGAPASQLLLTGLGVDAAELRSRLDACATTDAELAGPAWPDPFADALGPARP